MGSYSKTIAGIINQRTGRDVLEVTRKIKARRESRLADKNISKVLRRMR
jgi:flavodoxin